jgi:hypothetical protein
MLRAERLESPSLQMIQKPLCLVARRPPSRRFRWCQRGSHGIEPVPLGQSQGWWRWLDLIGRRRRGWGLISAAGIQIAVGTRLAGERANMPREPRNAHSEPAPGSRKDEAPDAVYTVMGRGGCQHPLQRRDRAQEAGRQVTHAVDAAMGRGDGQLPLQPPDRTDEARQ